NLDAQARLPRALFDSVADNLIRNALSKRAAEPGIRVRVTLSAEGLFVCDTGSVVAPELSRGLLQAPVASASGLGIGLHQAGRQVGAGGVGSDGAVFPGRKNDRDDEALAHDLVCGRRAAAGAGADSRGDRAGLADQEIVRLAGHAVGLQVAGVREDESAGRRG